MSNSIDRFRKACEKHTPGDRLESLRLKRLELVKRKLNYYELTKSLDRASQHTMRRVYDEVVDRQLQELDSDIQKVLWEYSQEHDTSIHE